MTLHGEAKLSRVTDRHIDGQTDTAHIDNSSLHLMHLMQPNNIKAIQITLCKDIENNNGFYRIF